MGFLDNVKNRLEYLLEEEADYVDDVECGLREPNPVLDKKWGIVWKTQQQAAPPTVVSNAGDERACPWCAEDIKAAAIICRFCQRDVEPVSETGPASQAEEAS